MRGERRHVQNYSNEGCNRDPIRPSQRRKWSAFSATRASTALAWRRKLRARSRLARLIRKRGAWPEWSRPPCLGSLHLLRSGIGTTRTSGDASIWSAVEDIADIWWGARAPAAASCATIIWCNDRRADPAPRPEQTVETATSLVVPRIVGIERPRHDEAGADLVPVGERRRAMSSAAGPGSCICRSGHDRPFAAGPHDRRAREPPGVKQATLSTVLARQLQWYDPDRRVEHSLVHRARRATAHGHPGSRCGWV